MGQPKADNIHWHQGELTRESRWKALGAKGATLWFTGLSGSGKSTVAAALEHVLVERGIHAYRLDGDNIRHGLNRNLGFSAEDRQENIRRIGEVARLFADAGTLAIASFISPYAADRDLCRALHEESGLSFLEIYVCAPLSVCESRDPKGLYQKARAGEITGFTGIDDPYEVPARPDLVLETDSKRVEDCVSACLELLEARGLYPASGPSG
jgi:adenylylsulfate kinase